MEHFRKIFSFTSLLTCRQISQNYNFLTSFGIINFAYRNPLRIIRTFISQNQTFKYRCGLHTETIFKNFFSFIEVLLFLVDLQVPHRWCSSISTISFETYVQPLWSHNFKKYSNYRIYNLVLFHDHKDRKRNIRLVWDCLKSIGS